MHLTISRIIGFSMAVAMLGLVACAPKPNPEPFQEPTPAQTVTETAAPAEGEATPEATSSPAAEGEAAQATASPAAEGEAAQATASPAAEGEAAPAAKGEQAAATPSSSSIVELVIEADKVTAPKAAIAMHGPVTFSVVNKTELPYKFNLEGFKDAVIEEIPSGETGTLTYTVGPGNLAVTCTELRTVEDPTSSPIKTVMLTLQEGSSPDQHSSKAELVK